MRPGLLYALPVLLLIACNRHYQTQKQEFEHYALKEKNESPAIGSTLAAYKKRVDAETDRIIATTGSALTRNNEQSELGNFVCDALKYASDSILKNGETPLIIVNRGSLRINLPKGDIKVGTVFELMPFENEMTVLYISGRKLPGFIPLFEEKKHSYAGAAIKLMNNTVTSFLINGQAIDPLKTYCIITSDYLANGGDNFVFLQNPVSRKATGLKVRDAIILYCEHLQRQGKTIMPYSDERLEISK